MEILSGKSITVYRNIIGLFLLVASLSIQSQTIYKTATLEIDSIAPNTYVHRTFMNTQQWGKVSCNGAIYVNSGEAVVFDTPSTDSVSVQLIDWIKSHTHATLKAIVVNHAHDDCLGGLAAFHKVGVPSYSSVFCQQAAKKSGVIIPQHGFKHSQKLKIGNSYILNYYPGAGHTTDNIVSYIPEVKVLFGGCIIKAMQATKGNLAEANVKDWSGSVRNIKQHFPKILIVIPGHGTYGGCELLNYTIDLFN